MKLPKNVGGRLGQFLDLRGNGKKKGGAGGGRRYSNAHYELGNNFKCDYHLLMPISSLLI